MLWIILSLLWAQEPDEIIRGGPIFHSKGIAKVYRHIVLELTPKNCVLPNDPIIINHLGLSNRSQNYRKHILDEKSENFKTGQFQVYIPVSMFPLVQETKGYMFLRMPSTLSSDNTAFVTEKQELYFRIKKMIQEKKGSVQVVVEIPDGMRRNIFFRQASGRYIDYVGQYKKQ